MRQAIQRRARLALLVGLGILAAALLLAHSAVGAGHHGEMAEHSSAGAAIAVCLAVLDFAGMVALLRAGSRRPGSVHSIPGRRAQPRARQRGPIFPTPLAASARAGPAGLQVFRL